MQSNYTEKIKNQILRWGADLAGIADLDSCREMPTIPSNLIESFSRGVSIAVQLPISVFEMISDQPTPIYAAVYQTANRLLDEIAFRTAVMLQKDGFPSLPVPASQILDRKNFHGAISHKAVARMAGLGWQGKNLLLITSKYGSRVRLVTVLTKAPLENDQPIENHCGRCTQCQEACPSNAIKGLSTKNHYSSRNEALHFDRCVEKLTKEFTEIPEIGVPICGICIKVCPFGRKLKNTGQCNRAAGDSQAGFTRPLTGQ